MVRRLRAAFLHSAGSALVLLALGCGRSHARPVERPSVPTSHVAAEPPRRVESRPASRAELAIVATLMHETELLRGLPFLGPVDVTIEERGAMRAYVERAIDDEQLARASRRYLALGALNPPLDTQAVRELLISVMDEELVGYYDPQEKRLAVRADIARALGSSGTRRSERSLSWRATVVHELVHALQDQHFGLASSITQLRSTDADNAFGALIEGDATLVMLGYTQQEVGGSLAALVEHPEQILSAMTRAPEQLTGALRRAPPLLREPLLFRYREGAYFCAQLFRAGGWAKVDAAHRSPPSSTLSIRSASRFLAHTEVPTVALPPLAPLTSQGFRMLDEDVLGALELSVLLGLPDNEAAAVVAAWRGDRYAVLERGQQLASIWWLRFSTTLVAKRVAVALRKLGDPDRRVLHRGTQLLVTRALDEHAVHEVARLFPTATAAAPASARTSKAGLMRMAGGDPLATARYRH